MRNLASEFHFRYIVGPLHVERRESLLIVNHDKMGARRCKTKRPANGGLRPSLWCVWLPRPTNLRALPLHVRATYQSLSPFDASSSRRLRAPRWSDQRPNYARTKSRRGRRRSQHPHHRVYSPRLLIDRAHVCCFDFFLLIWPFCFLFGGS